MEPTFTIGETPPFYPEETAGSLGTVQEAANLWRSDSPKGVPVLWFTFDTTRGWLWTAGVAPAASSSTSQSTAGSEQGWTSVSNSMAGDGPHHGKDIGAGNKLLLRALHKWSNRTHSGHSQGVDFSPLPFLISEISVFVKGQRLLNAFPELMQVADLFYFENRLQKASSLLADSLQKGLFSNETNGALHAAVIKASQSQRKPFAAAATYISVFVLSMKKLFHAKTSSEASKVLHGVTSASTRASTIANAVAQMRSSFVSSTLLSKDRRGIVMPDLCGALILFGAYLDAPGGSEESTQSQVRSLSSGSSSKSATSSQSLAAELQSSDLSTPEADFSAAVQLMYQPGMVAHVSKNAYILHMYLTVRSFGSCAPR